MVDAGLSLYFFTAATIVASDESAADAAISLSSNALTSGDSSSADTVPENTSIPVTASVVRDRNIAPPLNDVGLPGGLPGPAPGSVSYVPLHPVIPHHTTVMIVLETLFYHPKHGVSRMYGTRAARGAPGRALPHPAVVCITINGFFPARKGFSGHCRRSRFHGAKWVEYRPAEGLS